MRPNHFNYGLGPIFMSCIQLLNTHKHQHTHPAHIYMPMNIYIYIYSASQKKRNREVSMFYHNLITTIINEWYIFRKLRVSSFMWCYSDDAYFTHKWLKAIWRKETKKTFGGRYLNFEEKFTFLESWVSALSYDTSIRKNEQGMTKFCLFKVVLAFP